jgi:23S rRNA pseudouridine1911/1915/1917 synthase
LALVNGKLEPEHGAIEAPVGRHPANRTKMAIVEDGKPAYTEYRVIQYLGKYTLLEVMPRTGRTHQIRVHLAAIGHPVVGDSIYGTKSHYIERQFLHALKVGFNLPSSGDYREFTCDLPDDLKKALNELFPAPPGIRHFNYC